jgi:lysophospholipase L1-like esterase
MAAIRLEAEDFNLSGNYQIDNNNGSGYDAASEGTVIAVQFLGLGNEVGTAQTNLNIDRGLYKITLTYFDENDGEGQLTVNLAGQELDNWIWNQQLQNSKVGESNRVTRVIAEETLINSGESLSLIGTRGNATDGESLRADYVELELIQALPEDEVAPTVQTVTANPLNLVPGNLNADYTFTIQYSDNNGVDPSSFDHNDIRVTGPGGLNQLATFVEADSNENGTPLTATYSLTPAGGQSWQEGTYSLTLEANQVSDTAGNFVTSGTLGEFTVEIADPMTLQAEDMTLNKGYVIKDRAFADNNQLIHLTELTGKATAAFNGTGGTYDVVLKHYDESDGQGTVKLTVGNNQQTITFNQDLAGSRPSVDNQVERTVFQGLQINPGDTIEIAAAMDKGEVVAIDGIQFIPVIADTTPPTATLAANNFNTDLNSTEAYTFTVTFEDNKAVDISNLNTAITVQDDNGVNQTVEFVGVDNNSNGSPRVVTYRLNAPGGSWDTNEAGTYTVSVAGNTVIDTSGNALVGGNLGIFNVNIQSTDLEELKVEAEDFTLGGNYSVENGYDTNIVSGGELIAIEFLGGGDETGTADYTFTGGSGKYNVIVTYFDESDGQGSLTANLNGQLLDSLTFNQNLGNSKVGATNRVQQVVAQDITINTGDTFSLAGQREGGESTRVDYVQFIPAAEDNTDPDPDINGETISYSQSNQPILARLDQDFAIKLKYDDPIKLMPLGDSITQGKIDDNEATALRSGYRNLLETAFDELGLKVDFVGSESNGKAGFDNDHQGHPGWNINQITFGINGEGGVEVWLPAANPDIVLLMIGTNDTGGQATNMINNLDTKLVPRIFNNLSSNSELIISSIPPVSEERNDDQTRNATITTYNEAIPGIVNKYDTLGKNISFVDIWEEPNGITATDMSGTDVDNGLHPTAAGYEKMASFYYEAVLDAAGTKTDFSNISNIVGSDFDDVIFGNDSNNEILGGEGDDELTGGGGADTFIYTKLADGEDILTDFKPAEGDIFQINASGFVGSGLQPNTSLSNGTVSPTGVFVSGINPQPIGNSANILYNTNTGILSMDLDGVGSQSSIILATLEDQPVLGVNQFEIA